MIKETYVNLKDIKICFNSCNINCVTIDVSKLISKTIANSLKILKSENICIELIYYKSNYLNTNDKLLKTYNVDEEVVVKINIIYKNILELSNSILALNKVLNNNNDSNNICSSINFENLLLKNYLNNIAYKYNYNNFNIYISNLYNSNILKLDALTYISLSTIIGAYLGDSLGSYCEFKKGHKDLFDSSYVFKQLNPIFGTSPGQLTDDSEMATCLCLSIVDNLGYFNPNRTGYYYCNWYLSNPLDIGNTTSKALGSVFKKINKSEFIYKDCLYFDTIYSNTNKCESLSNGFLMRKSPISVYCSYFIDFNKVCLDYDIHLYIDSMEKFYQLSAYDNFLTHGSSLTILASVLYNLLITRITYLKFNKLITNNNMHINKDQIKDISCKTLSFILEYINYLKDNKSYPYLNSNNYLLEIDQSKFQIKEAELDMLNKIYDLITKGSIKDYSFNSNTFYKSMGWFFHSLSACIWMLLRVSKGEDLNYIMIIKEIINLGGDTDTNAAIVGGIIGSLYGIENIPNEYLKILMNFNSILANKTKRDFIYSPICSIILIKELSNYIYDNNIVNTKFNNNSNLIKFDSSSCYALSLIVDFVNKFKEKNNK